MNAAQVALFEIRKEKKYFGGSLLKNSHAKGKRPITVQTPMHLVMRSEMARREYSLLQKERRIQQLIYDQGRTFGIKIYRLANAGNHLHLVILPRSRRAFKSFIRSISGLIARFILGAQRGHARGIRFWDNRPFTRIVSWGREYRMVCDYLLQNTLEAMGFLPYRPRRTPRIRMESS